jgi:ketosteroid isomerase-like protein
MSATLDTVLADATADGLVDHPFASAFLRSDIAAVADTLTDDVELGSPVITRRFRGKKDVTWLLANVMRCIDDPQVTDQVQAAGTLMMAFRTSSRGRSIQGVHLMRLADDGRIKEITVHMRPLSGLAAFASAIGPTLAGERTARGRLLTILSRPLALMTHIGDLLGSRIVFAASRRR